MSTSLAEQSCSSEEWRLDSALRHVRMATLRMEAISLYILLWRAQNGSGHIDCEAALDAITAVAGGSEALKELERWHLVSAEPHKPGLWIVHPEILDGAEAFASGRVP